MDINEESDVAVKCFKCKEQIHGSLNVIRKDSENTFCFWNKYQIFLYKDLNFESAIKVVTPEFQIYQLLLSNNYLVSVDISGNVHTTPNKFKNSGQKKFKGCFQPREQGIVYCIKYSSDYTLSLKLDSTTYFLCLHKINTEFQLQTQSVLKLDDKDWSINDSTMKKYILTCLPISKEQMAQRCPIFGDNIWKNHYLVLISFDKLNVFGCLYSQKDTEEIISLKKLYTSPVEICDVKIIAKLDVQVLIGLQSGSLIHLQLKDTGNIPQIIHLNTALSKFVIVKEKDSIIYWDGLSLWRADDIYSKENITFKQFIVRDVKDLILCDDQVICTTFTNLIYLLSIENENSYIKSTDDEYCPVDKILSNSECLFKIKGKIEKNKEIVNNINNESNYLTAVSLSRRQDIMDKIIQQSVVIYEDFEEVVKEYTDVILTEGLQEYFKPESFKLFLKIVATPIQHSMSSVLTEIFASLRIHITISTNEKILKNTTVKMTEPLKRVQILVPFDGENIHQIRVIIKLINKIPGSMDESKLIWTVLHRKTISLNAEHFIKTRSLINHTRVLKQPTRNIEDLIASSTENQHGDLFKVTDVTSTNNYKKLSFYVRLPHYYNEVLKNENTFKDHFPTSKASFIQKHLLSEEFLKSKSNIFFRISKEKVNLLILDDGFNNTLLEINSENLNIALDIRNFFADIFSRGKDKTEEFISNALYTTTENIQKALKCSSATECLVLTERFQKNVLGAMPL